MHFGGNMNLELLKTRMTELNMSTAQLIEKSNVSKSTVHRILHGKTDVHMSTLRMLAAAVDLDPSALFDEDAEVPEALDPSNVPEISEQILEELTEAIENSPLTGQADPVPVSNDSGECHLNSSCIISDPMSPIIDEGEQNVFETLNLVIDIYKERVSSMRSAHEKEIEHITAAHTDHEKTLKNVARALGAAAVLLMIFIIFIFGYDILDPTVGWFRY